MEIDMNILPFEEDYIISDKMIPFRQKSIVEVADEIEEQWENNGIFYIDVNWNTKGGFKTISERTGKTVSFHGVPGIYAFYKEGRIVYIGCTTRSIGTRISRYIKEVRFLSGKRESHPGGHKHRLHYKKDNLSNMHMIFTEDHSSLLNLEKYEKELIRRRRPLFNEEK